jgi:hypothetical protein
MLLHVTKTSLKECRLDLSHAEQLGDANQIASRNVTPGRNNAKAMDTSGSYWTPRS